jgi:hypothetical protein
MKFIKNKGLDEIRVFCNDLDEYFIKKGLDEFIKNKGLDEIY